jgi:hypothetical protein
VYDLDPDRNGMFDVVFCGALLAICVIPSGRSKRCALCVAARFAEGIEPLLELLARRVPAARLMTNIDQWWHPNTTGLGAMAYRAGFPVRRWGPRYLVPFGAGAGDVGCQRFAAFVARGRGGSGVLHRALLATPRPPLDSAS